MVKVVVLVEVDVVMVEKRFPKLGALLRVESKV